MAMTWTIKTKDEQDDDSDDKNVFDKATYSETLSCPALSAAMVLLLVGDLCEALEL